MNCLYKHINQKFLAILSFALIMAGVTHAQVTVDVKIDSMELLIGQQTALTLQVSADTKSTIGWPQLTPGDTIVNGVEVVDVLKPDTQLLNEGARMLIAQRYLITSFDSAFYYLPPLAVQVDGKRYESKSLALNVLSVPVDTVHTDRFAGPKDVIAPPFDWSEWAPIFWYSMLLLLWALLLTYLFIRYRDNKPIIKVIKLAPRVLPHTKALQEINLIKSEKVWAQADSKEYYTKLTAILRTYIESRYGFNAMEMTSSEIIDRLLTDQTPESIQELKSLFETADLVKFAKYNTLINENDMNLVNAIQFIDETKVEPSPEALDEPNEVIVEQKRSRRQILLMRLALVLLTLLAAGVLVWILILLYDLLVS